MSLSDATGFRRSATGVCLIVGPLLILIATVVNPAPGGDTEEYLADIAANPGRQQVASLLFYFGFVLLIPGLFGLVHLMRTRAVALGHIAAVLTFLGLTGIATLSVTGIPDLSLVDNLSREQAVEAVDGIEDYAGALVFIIVTFLGLALGLILLGIAVWRGGLAPVWVPVLIGAAVVVLVVGGEERVGAVVANGLLLAAFGFLGTRMLGMSNAEWDHRGDQPDPVG